MNYIYVLLIIVILIILITIIYNNYNNNDDITELCLKINSDKLNDNLKEVYVISNVLSLEECNYIINESEIYGSIYGWKNDRHEYHPTVDNDIKNIPNLKHFIENMVYKKIIPKYEHYYNIPTHKLNIDEIFIVKYSIGGQTFLEPHIDGDEFSFVITLNNNFTGGGTYFINTKEKINSTIGSAVIFCGKNKHMGLEITSGTRYILAGFLSFNNKYCDTINTENFKNLH